MAGEHIDSSWDIDELGEEGESSWMSGRTSKGAKRTRNEEPVNEGQMNVIVRFEGEGGVRYLDPLKLAKIIKNQVGELSFARVLNDGNLLIGCKSEEQCRKAQNLQCVGKSAVA